jgi:hypothetical protein
MAKFDDVLSKLAELNIEKRGHEIHRYRDDGEIAVYGINVPMLADCKQIAAEVGVDYKVDNFFDMFIFYVEAEDTDDDDYEKPSDEDGFPLQVGDKVIWHDPNGETDDSRVWEVYDIKCDVVCISTNEPFYSEAEVWGNELSIVF